MWLTSVVDVPVRSATPGCEPAFFGRPRASPVERCWKRDSEADAARLGVAQAQANQKHPCQITPKSTTRARPTHVPVALAVAGLTGTLDGEVVLLVDVVCAALHLDAGALAAAVRR